METGGAAHASPSRLPLPISQIRPLILAPKDFAGLLTQRRIRDGLEEGCLDQGMVFHDLQFALCRRPRLLILAREVLDDVLRLDALFDRVGSLLRRLLQVRLCFFALSQLLESFEATRGIPGFVVE